MARSTTATPKKTTSTTRKTSTRSKAATAQATENTSVEEPKAKLRVKELDIHDYIHVKNGFHGTLIFKSSRTGEKFVWNGFGDEQDIELQDLKSAKSAQKKFFEKNWFLFDDPAVIEYLGVEQYYKNSLNANEFEDLFDLPVDEVIDRVSKIPAAQKRTLAYFARKQIADGRLDSIRLVTALEEMLGVQLTEK